MAASSADSLPATPRPDQLSEDQGRVVDCLSKLHTMSRHLMCILAEPQLRSRALRGLGFHTVKTIHHYRPEFWRACNCPPDMNALLLVQVGLEMESHVLESLAALADNDTMPIIIVVIILRGGFENIDSDGGRSTHAASSHGSEARFNAPTPLGRTITQLQDTVMYAGADDVITLEAGAALQPARLVESVHRVEVQFEKLRVFDAEVVELQQQLVDDAESRLSRQLQIAWRKSMWKLPGSALSSIPMLDRGLREKVQFGGTFTETLRDGTRAGVGPYMFEARLGRGSYGTVFKAYFSGERTSSSQWAPPSLQVEAGSAQRQPPANAGSELAVKAIAKRGVTKLRHILAIDQEFAIVLNLPPHPNIIRAYAAFHGRENVYLVMEYAGNANLQQYSQNVLTENRLSKLPQDTAVMFVEQMASAIAQLHGCMVVHRDIKPTNFMVRHRGPRARLILIDFGLAVVMCGTTQKLTQCCGSMPFCAPEILRGIPYNPFKTDIWMVALNFVELCCGPFTTERLLGWVPAMPRDLDRRVSDTQRLPGLWMQQPDTGVPGLRHVVFKMLNVDPDRRLSITQVLGKDGLAINEEADNTARPMPCNRLHTPGRGELSARPVMPGDGAERDTTGATLLDRIGGRIAIADHVKSMFNGAFASAPFALQLDVSACDMALLRKIYVDAMCVLYSRPHDSMELERALEKFRKAHAEHSLQFSDIDFDILCAFYEEAIQGVVVEDEALDRALSRFCSLRLPATELFRSCCACARSFKESAAWVNFAAEASARSREFGAALLAAIQRCDIPRLCAPPPGKELEDVEQEYASQLLQFVRGEAASFVSVQVGRCLTLEEAGEIIECARDVLQDENFEAGAADIVQYSVWSELNAFRLKLALHELKEEITRDELLQDAESWALLAMRLRQYLSGSGGFHVSPVDAAGTSVSSRFLTVLGMYFASLKDSDEDLLHGLRKRLARGDLYMTHAQLDAVTLVLPAACEDLLPDICEKITTAVRAMRPLLVRDEAAL